MSRALIPEYILENFDVYDMRESPEKWSEAGAEQMAEVFEKYPKLKLAYDLVQELKKCYDRSRCKLDKTQIKNDLYEWYKKVKKQ
ncbi:hypothetical protein FACS189429_8350 [Bacteroidia bacterium]|nr:hypothetical protein FACS189429_8350 [Bacteroidia bacterium]